MWKPCHLHRTLARPLSLTLTLTLTLSLTLTLTLSKVMAALRTMNEPYPLAGAEVATRYCSPQNRASELSPEVFARYLEDPWYSVLAEWDEKMDDEDEEDEEEEDQEEAPEIT